MNKLKFTELKVGMRVKDDDGNIGIIKKCKDIHNVEVNFEVGGAGIYCLDENDNDYYDPIYRYEYESV